MKRLPVTLTGVVTLLFCLLLLIFEPPFVAAVSRQAFDVFLRATAVPPRSGSVVMLDIDERSLSELGQWPWSRRIVRRLTDRLWEQGAALVVFDIVFPEEDRTSPAVIRKEWSEEFGRAVEIDGVPAGESDFDAEFAAALGRGKSVLGSYMEWSKAQVPLASVEPDDLYRGRYFESGKPQSHLLPQAKAVVQSIPSLRSAAAAEAFFNTLPDPDNIIRRTPLLVAYGPARIYPSLSLESIRLFRGQDNFQIEWDETIGRGVKAVSLRDLLIPTDANGQLVLNFRSEPFPAVSARDVLSGAAGGSAISNRIVLVGTSAAGLRDIKATPIGADVPGIEVHCTAVDNVLAGDMLREPRWMPQAMLGITLMAGLILIALMNRTRAWIGFLFALLAVAAVSGASFWVLRTWRLVMLPAGPVLSIAILYTMMTVVKFWLEERGRRRIRTMFQTMVSGQVLRHMEDNPGAFSLVGRRVEATVFFSDVSNFTAITERLDPDVLTKLMNRYMTPMAEIIMKRDGYVDKFNGDAIMAVWGAPNEVRDHAVQACLAALEQVDLLKGLSAELARDFGHELRIRIGISSGACTAGNMGSEQRFQYTVLGDVVNVAARLQDVNKELGTTILISSSTYEAARDHIEARRVGDVNIRGKAQPVLVYELLGRKV